MGKRTGPKRGSMQFYPRRKTKRIYPSISTCKKSEQTKLLYFPVYKAGMTHVMATDTYENSTSVGQEIAIASTILEAPEIMIIGIRVYEKTHAGLKAISEVLTEKLPKGLERKLIVPKNTKTADKIQIIEKELDRVVEVRVIAATQPTKINLKKTPEVIEITVGGKDSKSAWEYAKSILGKEVKASDVLQEGTWIDVIGVTKGKGTQGPVKRFGIKIQIRKAKGHRRRPGSIGAWHPARVLYTVPQAGQLGFFKRTEYNKRLLKIGENGKEIVTKGGITNYGLVNSAYVLVKGSVPGPKKRLIIIREAIRGGNQKMPPITISHISINSQQG